MKITFNKNCIVFLLLITGWQVTWSQVAGIKGIVQGAPNGKIYLVRAAYPFYNNNNYEGFKTITLDNKGEFEISLHLNQPEIMKAYFNDSTDKQLAMYNIYLTAGDRVKMKVVAGEKTPVFTVTGPGANNNQPLPIDGNDSVSNFAGDTLPARVMAYLLDQNKAHVKALNDYVRKYKPTPAFVRAWKVNLQYEVLNSYYSFYTNNAYRIRKAYERNYDAWNNITQSLYKNAPLQNEAALVSVNYRNFIRFYMLRTKERLWSLFNTNRAEFLFEWYGIDTAAGAALFNSDRSNDLQQRIIEKYFAGNVIEYLYAVLINGALSESEIENLLPVYEKFRADFPASNYLLLFKEGMKAVIAKRKRELTPQMKFINGDSLFKKWEDITAYYKGQAVLLDMWGTWCGPCRQDLDRHSAFIKEHFKGTPLTYLYIANNDTGHEKIWKELIAYFHLEGDHFMANKALTTDIMNKVKGQGFPTYVIIHKDGTFELYDRGYGIDRVALVAQLENALKQ